MGKPTVWDALHDGGYWSDVGQGVTDAINRGAIGQTLGAPVDMITLGLNSGIAGLGYLGHKAGVFKDPPALIENPVGGSEWFGKQMQNLGLVSPNRNPTAEMIAGGILAPGVGGMVQSGRAAQLAAKLQENAAAPTTLNKQSGVVKIGNDEVSVPGVTDEQLAQAVQQDNVLSKFGSKADREAKLAKKVQKAAATEAAPADATATTAVPKAAVRVKVDPDKFRKMEQQQGSAATLNAIRNGEHLKPDGSGGYVGAPRTVNSPQSLGAMRRSLDNQFDDAVEAVQWADPTRVGTWYDRAKAGQAVSNEPYQMPRSLDQHAVYSAGVAPESELAFSLKHANSRALGDPGMAYRGAGMRTLDKAVAGDVLPNFGFKIGEYRNKNDPSLPNTGLFGVNDFRAAQGFGYTTPDGKIWNGGVSATMHPFMDGETALIGDRANAAGIGGRTDWQGPHIQEMPWVLGKGQDLYRRGINGAYKGDKASGVASAIQDANNTLTDYFYKHIGSGTWESVPGANTGHVPSMLDAPYEQKLQYHNTGRWDVPSPEAGGVGNKDALYSAIGLRQVPSVPSSGMYTNTAGITENNPMTIARPLLDYQTGGGLNPNTTKTMNAVERLRAAIDGQEAYAWNLPEPSKSATGKNAFVLDTRDTRHPTDPFTGVQPTGQQLADIQSVLPDGFGVGATSRGALVFPFDKTAKVSTAQMGKKLGALLQEKYPSQVTPTVVNDTNTGYGPGLGKMVDGDLIPTAPYSGEATGGLLQTLSEAPPEVATRLGESEGVRNIIRQKIERDAALPGARGDIQNMRNFLAEADWPKAVEMIRKGMTPAAAVSALGYSINSMAADQR